MRGGQCGPITDGQGRGELRSSAGGGRCGRAQAAAEESGVCGWIVFGANMSLSNKLTLDKVDVKGKRVVMR